MMAHRLFRLSRFVVVLSVAAVAGLGCGQKQQNAEKPPAWKAFYETYKGEREKLDRLESQLAAVQQKKEEIAQSRKATRNALDASLYRTTDETEREKIKKRIADHVAKHEEVSEVLVKESARLDTQIREQRDKAEEAKVALDHSK